MERAYRLAFGRAPESAERDAASQFLRRRGRLSPGASGKNEPAGATGRRSRGSPAAEGAAWVDFCHALMNANEFLYVTEAVRGIPAEG